jgi:hypothetical protein
MGISDWIPVYIYEDPDENYHPAEHPECDEQDPESGTATTYNILRSIGNTSENILQKQSYTKDELLADLITLRDTKTPGKANYKCIDDAHDYFDGLNDTIFTAIDIIKKMAHHFRGTSWSDD